jgi:SEC-C motif
MEYSMTSVYAPCLCGSGKKFKFCCYQTYKQGEMIPDTSASSKFPIYECKVIENWEETGISPVYVVRELANGAYVFVSYLVDFWCLGIKDVIIKIGITESELMHLFKNNYSLITIPYQDARSLVLGAIDFARTLDIPPHSSWNGVASSFIEANQPYEQKFSFGKDGSPLYFSGPYDHENYNVEEIMTRVKNANGHFIINVS